MLMQVGGHHGNSTTSVAYMVTTESCNDNNNNKNNEGIVYFSSHYNNNNNNGVSENCQPILDYLSNDVEVIDLNIPAAVVHLDETSVSGTTSVLGENQLTSTLYEVNPLANNNNNDNNNNFTLTYSDSTESLLKSTNIVTTSSEQQSLSVICTVNQNDHSNNDGEQSIFDTVTVLNSTPSAINSEVLQESTISLELATSDSNDASFSSLNNERIDCLKEYLNFNKTPTTEEALNNSIVYTLKDSLHSNDNNNNNNDNNNNNTDLNSSPLTNNYLSDLTSNLNNSSTSSPSSTAAVTLTSSICQLPTSV
ncbi:unnamed protein product [Trichobilharzia szidati]|nr:unnamed protein product [Trichobilharzia szidati]